MKKLRFTQNDFLSELFFNLESGVVTWRFNKVRCKAGSRAGCLYKNGYRFIKFRGVVIQEHQILWFIANGCWAKEIDHINGIRDDNRRCNLRSVTRSENNQNVRSARKDSKSGVLGVCWHKMVKKWNAQIVIGGKKIHLGVFPVIEDAIAARKAGELRYFPSKPRENASTTIFPK